VVKISTTYAQAYANPDALRAGFDYYRAIEVELAQSTVRIQRTQMPVILIAGGRGVCLSMLTGLAQVALNVSEHSLRVTTHVDDNPAVASQSSWRAPFRGLTKTGNLM